jgi:2-polyprenyl-3-methyl-5-hydroxy-6-metoxy-1,4-benzoquinol methylase
VAEDLFGFPSFVGELEAYVPAHTFHVITMWDVLEHVADPVSLVKRARSLLLPGGVLFLRTPNLDALERQVFGSRYHSFKAEHLFYFGPDSLVEVLERAGFRVAFLTTESHLLQGFFLDRVHGWARLLRGSDFFAAAVDGTYSVTPS